MHHTTCRLNDLGCVVVRCHPSFWFSMLWSRDIITRRLADKWVEGWSCHKEVQMGVIDYEHWEDAIAERSSRQHRITWLVLTVHIEPDRRFHRSGDESHHRTTYPHISSQFRLQDYLLQCKIKAENGAVFKKALIDLKYWYPPTPLI